jgi:hypothetical protein
MQKLIIGFEAAASRVEFNEPVNDSAAVKWTSLAATYRF